MIHMNIFKYIIMPSITYISIVQRLPKIPFVLTWYKIIGKNTNVIKNVGKSNKNHTLLYPSLYII